MTAFLGRCTDGQRTVTTARRAAAWCSVASTLRCSRQDCAPRTVSRPLLVRPHAESCCFVASLASIESHCLVVRWLQFERPLASLHVQVVPCDFDVLVLSRHALVQIPCICTTFARSPAYAETMQAAHARPKLVQKPCTWTAVLVVSQPAVEAAGCAGTCRTRALARTNLLRLKCRVVHVHGVCTRAHSCIPYANISCMCRARFRVVESPLPTRVWFTNFRCPVNSV